MTRPFRFLMLSLALSCLLGTPAFAYKQFMEEWMELYITDDTDEQLSADAKQAKCFICHQGKKKDNHNPYGIHFVERLGKGDRKDVEKIVAAIKEVGDLPSSQETGSPTYAELIAEGKLPGGTLEECKEEPKK